MTLAGVPNLLHLGKLSELHQGHLRHLLHVPVLHSYCLFQCLIQGGGPSITEKMMRLMAPRQL